MQKLIKIPHRVCESTCFINGLEDILSWKGADYIPYLLSVLGGMGEFTYLRFKLATPLCMVYFGANPKYLLGDLEQMLGFKQQVFENRIFKNTFPKIKEFIDRRQPVVAGALDMYYLHYYTDIYHKQHIPIHYVLLVGYDDSENCVFVHDCTFPGVQKIAYDEFEKSLNVNVPGMSKKNTFRIFNLPDSFADEFDLAKNGFIFRAEKMLNPPVALLGIPAMRKLSKEVFDWNDDKSFDHLIMYATTPPHMPVSFDNSTGMRKWKSEVLDALGKKYNIKDWLDAAAMFENSGRLIAELCRASSKRDRRSISELVLKVADIEEKAYKILIK
ncbi:MAG: hypothetical protein FJW66_09260 [Actinobacteria bacterium]|nr:hypothetical protein [Actinomycetota bacterium]